MPKITIDSIAFDAPAGVNLIEAARLVGITIPAFCYHPGLRIVGQCRICLVEVEGSSKLQPGCATVVREGMVVHTDTERVKKIRAQVMEFLLINHPLDCPICDQAGECDLQDFCEAYAFPKSRFEEAKRVYPNEERRSVGPHVFQNQNRCIHCTRCIRFCRDISETGELTFSERGHKTLIDVFPGKPLDNAWSACTADLCPVGALTVKDFRFKERVWNLESVDALCPHCGNGCAIRLQHRSGVVKRFLPRTNGEINHYWLCDYGRFNFEWMNGASIFEPFVDGTETVWEEALGVLAQMIANAKSAAALASPFLSLEEMHLLKRIFPRVYLLPSRTGEIRIRSQAGWLASKTLAPNRAGAKKLNITDYKGESLDAALVFHHPLADVPKINANAFFLDTRVETPLAAEAAGILPGSYFAEKEGTYLTDQGWLQRSPQAFPPSGLSRPAWAYLLDLAKALGKPMDFKMPQDIFKALPFAEGRTYADLPLKAAE
jgi:NADH-quinone oxidoreductase subunit G